MSCSTKKLKRITERERKAFYGVGPSGKPNPAGNRHERRKPKTQYNTLGHVKGMGMSIYCRDGEIRRIKPSGFGSNGK